MLDQDAIRAVLSYDSQSGEFRWKAGRLSGRKAGAKTRTGYRQIQVFGRNYLAHRLAWLYHYGEWPQMLDHVNRVRSDNRICNLRLCDEPLNQQNRHIPAGYTYLRAKNRFQARIRVGGKRVFLGLFRTAGEAASAYAEAKRRMHPFSPA